jgi:hypothetical protein
MLLTMWKGLPFSPLKGMVRVIFYEHSWLNAYLKQRCLSSR